MSAQFEQGAGDGLLGLAWGSINTVTPTPVATPVENMISQEDIPSDAELFTVNLGSWRDADEADKGASFYTFGYIDQDVVGSQEIYYTPVDNSQGFWMFDSTSATVNGKTVAQTGNQAIADTGTTLALVSDETCQAIYDAIPGSTYDSEQQGYTFPSNTSADDLPVVTFAVGGKQFAVQKEDLGFADAGNGMVYGGIQSRGSMTFDILGDTFLKGIYAVSFIPHSFLIVRITNIFSRSLIKVTPDLEPFKEPKLHRTQPLPQLRLFSGMEYGFGTFVYLGGFVRLWVWLGVFGS